jgi:hypothetical protein
MRRSTIRPLSILVAALVTITALAVATAGISTNDQGNPSSRSAGKLGTLALYTWFQNLGLQVHRVSGSFDLGSTDVLILYDPTVEITNVDVASVLALLKSGGDVVVVTDLSSIGVAQPLLNALDVQVERPVAGGNAVPEQPFDATSRVTSVPVSAGYSFAQLPPTVPLLETGQDAVAAATRIDGGGRAYVIGNTLPLSNDGLRHADSEFFALSLLQRARGGRVGFDEYHHGEGGQAAEGAAVIFNGPIGVAAVLAALIVLAAVAINGRRLGKPIPAGEVAAVPSAAAYVAALGRLLSRSRQRGAIAARYADELKRFVGERTGMDAHLDDSAFAAGVRAAGGAPQADALGELLRKLRTLQASTPDEQQLLRAAREVDSFEQEWAGGAQLRR